MFGSECRTSGFGKHVNSYVEVYKELFAIFLNCLGLLLPLVSGIFGSLYVCVRAWKLRCIFEWSWTKLLHRLCPFVSLLGAFTLAINTLNLSTRTRRCLNLPQNKLSINSFASVSLIQYYFVAKTFCSFFRFWDLKQIRLGLHQSLLCLESERNSLRVF